MEQLLARLARQLEALDEASLMALWNKYATMTSRFEPSKRWEEAALIFSLIQAKRWKNQLFNYHWSQQIRAHSRAPLSNPMPHFSLDGPAEEEQPAPVRCRVLEFQNSKGDTTPTEK
jgi:hypothetical protein